MSALRMYEGYVNVFSLGYWYCHDVRIIQTHNSNFDFLPAVSDVSRCNIY